MNRRGLFKTTLAVGWALTLILACPVVLEKVQIKLMYITMHCLISTCRRCKGEGYRMQELPFPVGLRKSLLT